MPRWEAEPNYGCARRHRARPTAAAAAGAPLRHPLPAAPAAAQALGEGLDGLSIVKPPYGVMAAIDLKNGKLIGRCPTATPRTTSATTRRSRA